MPNIIPDTQTGKQLLSECQFSPMTSSDFSLYNGNTPSNKIFIKYLKTCTFLTSQNMYNNLSVRFSNTYSRSGESGDFWSINHLQEFSSSAKGAESPLGPKHAKNKRKTFKESAIYIAIRKLS